MWWIEAHNGKVVDITKADMIDIYSQSEAKNPLCLSQAALVAAAAPHYNFEFEEWFYVTARFANEKNLTPLNKCKTRKEAEDKAKELKKILELLQEAEDKAKELKKILESLQGPEPTKAIRSVTI